MSRKISPAGNNYLQVVDSAERILVTGAHGFLGKHVVKALSRNHIDTPSHYNIDLLEQGEIESGRYKAVIHLAALCGGIGANRTRPYDFLYQNLQMGLNVLEACRLAETKLVLVGTACSYPGDCPVPFSEGSLWDGYPEPTNAPYGLAKRLLGEALWQAHVQYFMRGAYPILANLYGPGDNFNLETSHVIPAIIRRMWEAKESGRKSVVLWGSGTPTRDFLYVEDAAEAIAMTVNYEGVPNPINIGTGLQTSISDVASDIASIIGFDGTIEFDNESENGQLERCLDSRVAESLLGWKPKTHIIDGLEKTVAWYLESEHVNKRPK